MQPTDVNENKELPPSSDFLSPFSTGEPVGHGTSEAGNTTVPETEGRKKRSGRAQKRSAVGSGGVDARKRRMEGTGEFRGVYSDACGEITLRQAQLYRYRETDRL